MKAPVPPVPTGRELLEQFRSCTILPSHFGHAQHIEVAWHYVRRWPLLEAMGNEKIILTERGELLVAKASPKEFTYSARAQALADRAKKQTS